MLKTDQVWIQGEAIPDLQCFGCGPTNHAGLGLRSWADGDGDEVRASWRPGPLHQGGGRFLCGDCRSPWPVTGAVTARGCRRYRGSAPSSDPGS
jgi:hypothetical protein